MIGCVLGIPWSRVMSTISDQTCRSGQWTTATAPSEADRSLACSCAVVSKRAPQDRVLSEPEAWPHISQFKDSPAHVLTGPSRAKNQPSTFRSLPGHAAMVKWCFYILQMEVKCTSVGMNTLQQQRSWRGESQYCSEILREVADLQNTKNSELSQGSSFPRNCIVSSWSSFLLWTCNVEDSSMEKKWDVREGSVKEIILYWKGHNKKMPPLKNTRNMLK